MFKIVWHHLWTTPYLLVRHASSASSIWQGLCVVVETGLSDRKWCKHLSFLKTERPIEVLYLFFLLFNSIYWQKKCLLFSYRYKIKLRFSNEFSVIITIQQSSEFLAITLEQCCPFPLKTRASKRHNREKWL